VPVTVGIEFPRDEQARIDAFLASAGGDPARAALLAGPFWHRPFQDGRTSHGLLDLLERLRALRAGGRDVRVVAFDQAATSDDGARREQDMADAVIAAHRAAPDRATVLLVGNLHARRSPRPPPHAPIVPMTKFLVDAIPGVVSLDVVGGPVAAWICTTPEVASCHVYTSSEADDRGAVRIDRSVVRDGYDGVYAVGEVHAATPAIAN
jgi:hypothetical protein